MAGGNVWAAGGAGGAGTSGGGAGGAGGGVTAAGAGVAGAAGGTASGSSAGSSGAAGTINTTWTGTANRTVGTGGIQGGNGAAGGNASSTGQNHTDAGGGGGGGGGAAVVSTTTGTLTINGAVTGGAGGAGGTSGTFRANAYGKGGGGGGGQGGTGLLSSSGGSVTNNATVKGGQGGQGGTATIGNGGSGGDGGTGVDIAGARTLTNTGTIQGGNGGAGGTTTVTSGQAGTPGQAGAGGVAIKASGGVTIINSGTITGGSSNGVTADAIQFSGVGNTLELQSGSTITGKVVATLGGTDSLVLGGTTNASFDLGSIGAGVQYRNFANYKKSGTSTWILTGSSTATTPWSIEGGTLQIGNGATAGSVTGSINVASGTTLSVGNGSTSGSLVGNIGNSGTVIFSRSDASTFTGDIAGTGTLTKSGVGQLTLTGTGNYSGGTTISAGTLEVGNGGTTGSITGNVTDNGTLAFNRSDDISFGGNISGNGSLTKAGAGKLTLTGTVNPVAGTTITAGTLQVGNGATSGSLAGNVTDNGALVFNRSDDISFAGNISGSGTLTKDGAGKLTLTGTVNPGSGTTIESGTLQVGNNGTTGSLAGNVVNKGALVFNRSDDLTFAGVISDAGSVTKQGAGTLTLTGENTSTGTTTTTAGTLQVGSGTTGSIVGNVIDNSVLVFNRSNDSSFAGNLSGTGTVTKMGAGKLTLTGTVGPDSGITIQAGTLEVGNGGTSGAITGNVTDNGALVFNRSNDSLFAGNIIGNGTVTKTGAGTLTLTGDSNYGGGTTISGGTLQVGNGGSTGSITGNVTDDGALVFNRAGNISFDGIIQGSGSVTKAGNGTLTLTTGVIATAGATTIQSGTLQVGNGGATGGIVGDVVNNGALVINRSDNVAYGGVVSGSGLATKLGAGTLTLTGDSNYTGGTTISAGTLQLGDGGSTGSIAGNVTNNGALVFNRADDISFDGVIQGSGSVTQQGGGTLVLTANNTYLGRTTISGGTLQLGNGGNGGSVASSLIDNNGTLAFNRADNATFAGSISGTGSVTKNGTGTTTLNGTNTYLGSTTVAGGTLRVDGTLANSAVDVNSGGTLTGSGSIANAVNVGDGATLRGTSGQTLTTGALTLASGSTIDAVLGAPSSQELFRVNGALTLDGQVNVTDLGGFGAGVYRLINYTGALTDNGLDVGTAPAGSQLSVQTAVAHQVNLVNTAGQTLMFWDGTNSANFNNGSVDGGGGTWTANGNYWTTANGSMNAAQPAPGFAVFQNQGGTVTIDNSQGAVSVTGMQFATDGYVVNGGPLTLSGTQAIIRVGDGSQVPVTAVIDAELTGSARLEKTDLGTLVLAGNNTYTGGTLISGGTLQLGNGGTTGSILGDVTNNGTLAFDRSDAATFAGTITGNGAVKQIGGGTTILTAANDYTGGTVISAGTLQLGNGGTTGSIAGDVVDNGTLAFNRSDAVTFAGAITGSGAVKQIGSGTTTLTADNNYTGGTVVSAGTLQLGNGGTTGSIVGGVVDNGTLAVNRSDAVTLPGAITGSGAVKQIGSGTTTLTGTNDYTGGTVISAGTLQLGNGGTTGSITGDVTNNGTLAFNRSDAATFAGAISGSGAVKQIGSGTTTLTGTNAYTGGTVISSGTLQLGNGGTTGSITGDVTNNGTLAFNRSDAVAFAGAITGSGAVQQVGGGTTTLTGANTYGGGTTISAGKLVGAAGSLGTGAIVDNAALEIRQASDAAMANAISGNGSITKTGAGALNYTGNGSAFTGSTLVQAGTLAVNGSLGGTLTMASGTTLKGNGTVGTTFVQSGATVAPGNSIGLLNVAGNLTLAQGSTYQVEASGDGRSDQIRATGTVTLQGGAVAVLADGNWNPTTSYSILSAAGGVNGTFGSVTTNFAFLDPSISYDAKGATLSLKRNDVSFSSVATTVNERASGAAVQAAAAGTLYDAVVQLDAPTAARAFRQITGELHASVKSATIEDSRFVRDASLDRTRLAQGGVAAPADLVGKNGVWARTFGSWGDMRSDGNASTVDRSTSGILIGGDTLVGDDWRVGGLGGYSRANVDVHALNSSASSDSYHLGVYGGRQWGALGLRAGASYTDSRIDTSRIVSFTGFADLPTASYKSQTAQAFGELGWRIEAGTGAVEPFAGLAYVNLHTDDFAERGGTASLHGGGGSTDTTFSTLGVRGSNNVDIGSMKATVHGMFGWRHAFGDVSSTSSLALAAQPAAFTVAGVPLARNVAVVEGGLDLVLKPNLTLGVSYIGQFGNSVEDHGVKADLVWKF